MRIGVVYPQTEYSSDPIAVRDYAQTVEGLGYRHILAYDHILGANPDRPGGWKGPYNYEDPFHEPFTLFSFLSGLTQKIEFATGIIILPQRQTALVAKQAATLDILSGGRLRLGIGLGWNAVEYTALNENFHNRGKRIEEQVMLLRELWTKPLINFSGRWHTVPDAGLNPLPVQRPIPIWFGGKAEQVLSRIAMFGDGWIAPSYPTPQDARATLEALIRQLEKNQRTLGDIGIDARIPYKTVDPGEWHSQIDGWRELGATHISINTMGSGFHSPREHLLSLERFAKEIGLNGQE